MQAAEQGEIRRGASVGGAAIVQQQKVGQARDCEHGVEGCRNVVQDAEPVRGYQDPVGWVQALGEGQVGSGRAQWAKRSSCRFDNARGGR